MISFILLMLATAAMAMLSAAVASGVSESVYSSFPMCLLWAVTGAAALALCLRRRLWRRPALMTVHVALLMILIGAAVTHFSGEHGSMHLRIDAAPTSEYERADTGEKGKLPFRIKAVAYSTRYYPLTSTPKDFLAVFNVIGNDGVSADLDLSVNKAVEWSGYKFVLKSVDSDGEGFSLNIRHDVTGTGISFFAYALLLLGSLFYFFQSRSGFRAALAKFRQSSAPRCCSVILALISLYSLSPADAAAMKIPDNVIERFGELRVLHDERVTTVAILSTDFVANLTGGRAYWHGHDAEEIFAGFLFDFSAWKKAPLIKVKDKELREILGLRGRRGSYLDYMSAVSTGRLDISDPAVTSRFAEDILRFESVTRLMTGELLAIYPMRNGEATEWLTPASDLPPDMDEGEWLMVKRSLGHVNQCVLKRDWYEAEKMLRLISGCQSRVTGLPPVDAASVKLERFYSRYGDCLWLALSSLATGLVFLCLAISCPFFWMRQGKSGVFMALLRNGIAFRVVTGILFLCLSTMIGIRWHITGHLPLANGFETMQFMGWIMLGAAFLLSFRYQLPAALSLLGSGLSLAVASMGGGAGSLGPLMPVLSSPLLSIHVMCVMSAYALFLMMALGGLTSLLVSDPGLKVRLTALGRVLLYPALFLLAAGIFIGAIWAEVSWGVYWSWDPKEVWALITLLVYSFAAHPSILRRFAGDRFFNVFVIVAFLTVIVTYFGVNFFLGGRHSYA